MTDTVNVPREWVARFVSWVEEWKGAAAERTVDEMFRLYTDARRFVLEAAPKAEPLSDPYKLEHTALVAELHDYFIADRRKKSLTIPKELGRRLTSALSAQPLSNPQQLEGEDAAWAWVNGRVECDPADIDYSADEMVDAFMAGQASRRANPEAPKVEKEPVVARSIEGETVSGFKVAAWRYLGPQDTGEFGHRYCEHWSTVGNHPKEVTRLFTEEQLLSAHYTHPASASDELLEALAPLANMAAVVGDAADDVVYVGQSGHRLTYGDFRRAASVYANHKGPQS